MRRQKGWTADETALLIRLYGTETNMALLAHFPGRSLHYLTMKAHELKLTKSMPERIIPADRRKVRQYGWHKHPISDYY